MRLGTARETRESDARRRSASPNATRRRVETVVDDARDRRDEDADVARELVRRTLDDAHQDALAARDFDDHFDDARVDWTNAEFDRAVDAALERAGRAIA